MRVRPLPNLYYWDLKAKVLPYAIQKPVHKHIARNLSNATALDNIVSPSICVQLHVKYELVGINRNIKRTILMWMI